MAQNTVNKQGKGMVDVSAKPPTQRKAIATGTISLSKEAFEAFITNGSPKGDVLETAKVAAVMAAKSTPNIIPMCHPLELNKVHVSFDINKQKNEIAVVTEVGYSGRTGVEMEALTSASVALLTIYDMMKWADKSMVISEVKLLQKSGGKTGDFNRSSLTN